MHLTARERERERERDEFQKVHQQKNKIGRRKRVKSNDGLLECFERIKI